MDFCKLNALLLKLKSNFTKIDSVLGCRSLGLRSTNHANSVKSSDNQKLFRILRLGQRVGKKVNPPSQQFCFTDQPGLERA